ncbi:MAG: 3-deoxy-8-phosphooctulonate synthase [Planctomycetes bacterium]|nr:3-deoxy-8-phosphooctulonate synthase [Planctomycetota bacterium]MCB9892680.1 3-deoxy-8-phosphooctulonate synthase [Planctomycetota bacterium]MCB9919756.1 3-deoxy-8-phosphooctulonate synthase [Planctomycetota bacterium]
MSDTAGSPVRIADVAIGGDARLALLAGPCVLESAKHAIRHASAIRDICERVGVSFVFKSSFDKANRTSIRSYRGPGLDEGLRWLREVRDEVGVPVLTDVHETHQCERAAEVVDVLQIPAFLCRQTDLLVAAAKTGKPVNIKKAQFLAPRDMKHPIGKVRESGNDAILVTERGTSFGYNSLVVDFTGLSAMRTFGVPIVFDATHSVQRPGGAGDRTGGDRTLVEPLARAAVSIGVDAIFMEVHEDPDRAPSDGPNMVRLVDLEGILERVARFDRLRRELPLPFVLPATSDS